jgi:hypothetical protein
MDREHGLVVGSSTMPSVEPDRKETVHMSLCAEHFSLCTVSSMKLYVKVNYDLKL